MHNDSICADINSVDIDFWKKHNFSSTMWALSYRLQPFKKGYLQIIRELHPKLGTDQDACAPDQLCETNILSENCDAAPIPTAILMAIYKWSNYHNTLKTQINDVANDLANDAAQMTNIYFPRKDPGSDGLALLNKILGFANAAMGFAIPLAPEASVLGELKPLVGGTFGKASAWAGASIALGDNPDADLDPYQRFSNFAEVSHFYSSIQDQAQDFLVDRIQDALRITPKPMDFTVPSNLDFGPYLWPPPQTHPTTNIKQILVSSTINSLWNASSVIIARFPNPSTLGVNVCASPSDPKQPFSNIAKYCAPDGSAYVLLTTDGDEAPGLQDANDKYGFTPDKVVKIAQGLQNSIGYRAKPASASDTLKTLDSKSITDIDPSILLFFNTPICDLGNKSIDWSACSDSDQNPDGDPKVGLKRLLSMYDQLKDKNGMNFPSVSGHAIPCSDENPVAPG